MKKNIRSISYVKANAAELIDQVNETHKPLYITENGEDRAVLLDPENYETLRESLLLMKIIAQSESRISKGETLTHTDVVKNITAKYSNPSKTNNLPYA